MPQTAHGFDNFLYGNVRVRRVERNQAAGALIIRAVYAEREEQEIVYSDVLYSQISKSVEGERIAMAVELMPDEYRGAKHESSSVRFQKDCNLQNLDSLEEMTRRGYRLFVHYIGERDECIVIAKSLRIS